MTSSSYINPYFRAPSPLKPLKSTPRYRNLPGESLTAHSDHWGPLFRPDLPPKTTVSYPKLTLFDLIWAYSKWSYVILCYLMMSYVIVCYFMLSYVTLCYIMLANLILYVLYYLILCTLISSYLMLSDLMLSYLNLSYIKLFILY